MPLDKKTILESVKQAKEKAGNKKFNQSVELILNLKEIDMKSPEGKIRDVIELPHITGNPNKVCVIASGELALKARKAKADIIIQKDELRGLAGKKKDLRKLGNTYDIFIAEAPLMPMVGKTLGPVLGPRGKMPVPVPPSADIASLIEKHRKTVVVKMRNQPIIQCAVGTQDMKDNELTDNIQAILRSLERKLKRGLQNIKLVYIKTSMGKPIKLKP